MRDRETVFAQLQGFGAFVRHMKQRARFGELSRAPLALLRIEVTGESAECDWLARPADVWDLGLPRAVGLRNASMQALRDAIAVRAVIFHYLPSVERAEVRVYRGGISQAHADELIITGTLARSVPPPKNVSSLAMRAKLAGFRFQMRHEILEDLQPEALVSNF